VRLVEGVARVDDLDDFLARLGAVGDAHGCTVQAFDARYVVDRTHLRRALTLADRAIERGENVARDRGMEVLLYAAGRRQIDQSLELGVAAGETPAVVLVAADPAATDPDETGAAAAVADLLDVGETLGAYDAERVRSFFDVGASELAVVDDDLAALVHERVALLDVEK
jgi:KEOPS complex subunit Cgi121